ncbi:MAG TPA: hypothetical protein VLW55_07815 [Burkholderiaceae bacterium]|nr:hypothetical protein [Burkholderiaceae bacterium]
MLDDWLVYAKTAKGAAEVASRSGAVSLAARRVLIMIDGKRNIAELAPLARTGEISAIVEQLEVQGLVQPVQVGAAGTTSIFAPPEAGEEFGEDRLVGNIDSVKRRAIRELADRLGPDAEVMASRIDHCRSTEELRQRLHEAERLVAGMLGEMHAQEFLRALRRR